MEQEKNIKRNKIIYWIATIWLSLGVFSGGLAQLLHVKATVDGVLHLGYPAYFLSIIGTWKILGTIALLAPKFPLVKEWAYAGIFFLMSGAIFSHAASGDEAKNFFGPLLLLVLTVTSWYFRPANRKMISVNQ